METNRNLVDAYITELEKLSADEQRQIIQRLQKRILPERKEPSHHDLDEIFGGFISSKSAEEIIREIYDSRTHGRELESLDQ